MAELAGSDVLDPDWVPPVIDTSVAHPARMYDYYLGGKDNYAADREAAEKVLAVLPEARAMALANRAFLGRAVRYLARAGVRQFLDIGTGIPGPGSTSETAHEVAPDAHIVYVDNDPIVLTHARALLAADSPGLTTVVQADLRQPDDILSHPKVREVIDFDRPVAVLLVAVLHFIRPEDEPAVIVERLKQNLAPGSYLVVSHGTGDFDPRRSEAAVRGYDKATAPFVVRDLKEVSGFFDGLDLVEPGVVQLPWWRPDGDVPEGSERIWLYAGIGRKTGS
ncbi:SAM-dependent methyltransferase [Catenulispora yoronensis]|uniref:SAM-dependent methyltransferase n=1 Tax=Catenulispora yoronensis TaxID=450799 RepID=A0ABN2UST1_9ACTN